MKFGASLLLLGWSGYRVEASVVQSNRLGLTDDDVRKWCAWFRLQLPRRKQSQNLHYAHIDFAENRTQIAIINPQKPQSLTALQL